MMTRAWFIAVLPLLIQSGAVHPQDEPPPAKAETVVLKVTVGSRPTNTPYNVAGFVLKKPLDLSGSAAEPEALKDILNAGIRAILNEQRKNGAWSFKAPPQPRAGPEANRRNSQPNFVRTAVDSTNEVVMTSLACMALRRHAGLNPEQIGPAIEKGLRYVIKNAPKHGKERYGPWTWAFSLTFMCEEYRHTDDADLRAEITRSAGEVVKRLLNNQHKGKREPPKPKDPPRESVGESPEDKDLPSNGGYFHMLPSEDDGPDPGVVIVRVEPDGEADKAGMKDGDRILAIGDQKINDLNDLYELIDSFKPGQTVEVTIARSPGESENDEKDPPDSPSKKGPIPEDGGWSYYAMDAVSFTTATCVLALMDARDIGVDVPADSIDRGLAFIEAMRLRREGGDEESYAYRQGRSPYKYASHTDGPKGRRADIRGTMGRISVCELALVRGGKRTNDHLRRALETFIRRRGELDKVRGYPGNHFVRSFYNSAYYFMYGHFYAAMASRTLPEAAGRKKIGAVIQEALLKQRNDDGTWTDHEAWGKLCGTAMAMMALGELKELAPALYKKSEPAETK